MLLEANRRALTSRIWALAWPVALASLVDLAVGFADLAMVRGFGDAATAAIGVARQVAFLVQAAAMTLSVGVITLVSQGLGARDEQQARRAATQGLLLVVVIGVPFGVLGKLSSRPLLVALGAQPQTLQYGVEYLAIYFLGIVFVWGNYVTAAIFRGMGNVVTPLRLAAATALLNVGLNYLFIFVLEFGVAGAAVGTVAARGVTTLIAVMLLVRGTGGLALRPGWAWRWDSGMVGRILRIGLPAALAGFIRNASRLAFLGIVAMSVFPQAAHAAVGLAFQVRMIGILPALAFQTATQTLVGQAMGRGRVREAEAIGRQAVRLLIWFACVTAAAIIVLAGPVGRVFIAEPQTALLATTVLRWFAVAMVFSALGIGLQGTLHGAGDTGASFRYTLLTQWGLMLPLAYGLVTVVDWGLNGAWVAWTMSAVVIWALLERRFRRGHWKSVRI